MTKEYRKIPLPKLETLVSLNIDDVTRHPEEKLTVVRGWAYDKSKKKPLIISVVAPEEVTCKVQTEYRRDVIEMFELDGDQDYGFVLEIHDVADQPFYWLNIQTASNNKIQYRLERPNMLQPGTKFERVMRSIQTRGLVGSAKWFFKRNEQLEQPLDEETILAELKTFTYRPKISVVVPVYNVEEKWLDACISSLKNQYYDNWELCLADDASPSPHIKPMLERFAQADERIKVTFRSKNGHISEATNSALAIATGQYIGFMDNDDELAPNALYEIVKALNTDQTIDFFYTDEDKVTEAGKRFNPFYKSNWNPELLLSHNYITHFVVVQRELYEKIGGLKTAFNGSQDYDFVLRATEEAKNICHISGIMYHWRAIESSTALNPESKDYAYLAGQRAVQAAADRRGLKAMAEIGEYYGSYKLVYEFNEQPKVSVIINGKQEITENYLRNLAEKTYYSQAEFVLSKEFKAIAPSGLSRFTFVDETTYHEKIRTVTGEYVVLLEAGLTPVKGDWLEELLNTAQRPEVGAVAGRLVDHRYRIENIGMNIDLNKKRLILPEKGTPGKSLGYYYRIALPRNVQAVSERCLIFRKADYLETKGLREELGTDWMGMDWSLQVRFDLGKQVIYSSYATLKTNEQQEPKQKGSFKQLAEYWSDQQLLDPYQNPKRLNQ